jgi:hypothetical protein
MTDCDFTDEIRLKTANVSDVPLSDRECRRLHFA